MEKLNPYLKHTADLFNPGFKKTLFKSGVKIKILDF